MRYFALKSALKLYCSFKVTEKQRQKINEEKDSEKQRQIEIERYIINVLVTHALVKVFIIFQLSCKRILLLHKSRFYMLCRGETADVIVQLQDRSVSELFINNGEIHSHKSANTCMKEI